MGLEIYNMFKVKFSRDIFFLEVYWKVLVLKMNKFIIRIFICCLEGLLEIILRRKEGY